MAPLSELQEWYLAEGPPSTRSTHLSVEAQHERDKQQQAPRSCRLLSASARRCSCIRALCCALGPLEDRAHPESHGC